MIWPSYKLLNVNKIAEHYMHISFIFLQALSLSYC